MTVFSVLDNETEIWGVYINCLFCVAGNSLARILNLASTLKIQVFFTLKVNIRKLFLKSIRHFDQSVTQWNVGRISHGDHYNMCIIW